MPSIRAEGIESLLLFALIVIPGILCYKKDLMLVNIFPQ